MYKLPTVCALLVLDVASLTKLEGAARNQTGRCRGGDGTVSADAVEILAAYLHMCELE